MALMKIPTYAGGGGVSGQKIQITLAVYGGASAHSDLTLPNGIYKSVKYVSGSAVQSASYKIDSSSAITMSVGNTYQIDSATTSIVLDVTRPSSGTGTASAVLELEYI